MKGKLWRYMGREVAIEYKACLYFFCILFFACCNLLLEKKDSVSILHLFEMIMTTYVMGYVQVCFLGNFDETERLDIRTGAGILAGTALYAAASWIFGWFGRRPVVTVLFTGYMLIAYMCAILANWAKRSADTENLNRMLEEYKRENDTGTEKRGNSHGICD